MQHPSRPTESRQEIVGLAAGLVPELAARAAATTRPTRSAARTSTSWWLPVHGHHRPGRPRRHGGDRPGPGRRPEPAGRGEPATALAVNMHLHGVGLLVGGSRTGWSRSSSRSQPTGRSWRRSSPSPSRGGNWWYQATTWPCQGVATVCRGPRRSSPARPRATHLFLSAAVETDSGQRPIRFLVPRPGRGIQVLGDWKAMGMRATGSNALAIDELEIPPECVVATGFPMAVNFLVGSHWSWPSFASVFLGAAEAAFRRRPTACPGAATGSLGQGLAELPGVRQAVGEMRMRLDAARATCSPPSPGRPTPTRWPTTGAWPGQAVHLPDRPRGLHPGPADRRRQRPARRPRWAACATPTPGLLPAPVPRRHPPVAGPGRARVGNGPRREGPAGGVREPRRGAPVYQSLPRKAVAPRWTRERRTHHRPDAAGAAGTLLDRQRVLRGHGRAVVGPGRPGGHPACHQPAPGRLLPGGARRPGRPAGPGRRLRRRPGRPRAGRRRGRGRGRPVPRQPRRGPPGRRQLLPARPGPPGAAPVRRRQLRHRGRRRRP